MRIEGRLFILLTVFLWSAAAVYAAWSREWTGTTALVLSGALTGLCGTYFWFVARRIKPRPEDRKDADISEGATENTTSGRQRRDSEMTGHMLVNAKEA